MSTNFHASTPGHPSSQKASQPSQSTADSSSATIDRKRNFDPPPEPHQRCRPSGIKVDDVSLSNHGKRPAVPRVPLSGSLGFEFPDSSLCGRPFRVGDRLRAEVSTVPESFATLIRQTAEQPNSMLTYAQWEQATQLGKIFMPETARQRTKFPLRTLSGARCGDRWDVLSDILQFDPPPLQKTRGGCPRFAFRTWVWRVAHALSRERTSRVGYPLRFLQRGGPLCVSDQLELNPVYAVGVYGVGATRRGSSRVASCSSLAAPPASPLRRSTKPSS